MATAAIDCYHVSTCVFVSGLNKQVSWTSQAWLTLINSVPSEISLRAIKKDMADPSAVIPLTPYADHHVADALASLSDEDVCLKLTRVY
ncbi:hypothetical protein BJ875DRAFT_469066 [Amylocarpus encephaloides]|uniref:Uncharacterized protein n=1 Tax=Amylocarpus encephaloides TaxID=45428 RepID=A0A9P8C328_9HELO|nr:hypothetical protein BJ875DRAFT_469066 [Amylocarpus encephaloides]